MSKSGRKVAVVLLNLGGPDGPKAVRPFLENLFSDPAIINLPWVARRPLAAFIARSRARSAVTNYGRMGGSSPLLGGTRAQATALSDRLGELLPNDQTRVFVAMRYWHPTTASAAEEVARFEPDDIVLAPLYPQFSTTTTGSSFLAWRKAYCGPGKVRSLCCWYGNDAFVEAHADRILRTWEEAGRPRVRLLFSAHGLPESIIARGDPYQWQIEQTCAKVAARLGAGWDWKVCYQSRVGPLRWLGPSTPEAIAGAAKEGLGIVIDPIAFVSDHIETLVELDLDYADLARSLGVSVYLRTPVLGLDPKFVDGLARTVADTLGRSGVTPEGASCPTAFAGCPHR